MAKLSRQIGTTSQIVEVFVQDSSSITGAGKTGILFNASGLACYYKRNTASSSTAVTLVTITTLGTYASGGWKEVDATNMPGVYEVHLPNAALVSGADSVVFYAGGAANMAPLLLEIELTATTNQTDIQVKKNQALSNFAFLMVSSTDHVTPKTGLTITAQRSIDGAAFASCANAATELSNGIYLINLAAADLNGNVITLLFSGSGADSRYVGIVTQA
jgi:hypothetical protein